MRTKVTAGRKGSFLANVHQAIIPANFLQMSFSVSASLSTFNGELSESCCNSGKVALSRPINPRDAAGLSDNVWEKRQRAGACVLQGFMTQH